MFGFSPTLPLANLWKIEDLLPNTPDIRTADRWKEARKNLLRAHERVHYNQGRTPNPFKVGDLVYCQSHPISSAVDKRAAKLCYRWSGRYRILRFVSPVTVKLGDPNSEIEKLTTHISKLKFCHGA